MPSFAWNENDKEKLYDIIASILEEFLKKLIEEKVPITLSTDVEEEDDEKDYSRTDEGLITANDYYIHCVKGSYDENELVELIYKQGVDYNNFKGTCGLCSTANLIRMLRVSKPDEKEMVDIAVDKIGICKIGPDPYSNGGTTPQTRLELSKYFGLDAYVIEDLTLEDVDEVLTEGGAISMNVYAEYLNSDVPNFIPMKVSTNHSITIIELKFDKETDEILGVYIQDTGGWIEDNNGFSFISKEKFNKMRKATSVMCGNANFRKE